jgi:predicted HicB family RNase H-like nuclease
VTYKGYTANVTFSDEDECFVGKVMGIRDSVTFDGQSVQEIREAFREAVDFYLETNPSPQQPFSGRFMLRLPPEIHARAAMRAAQEGKSLNQWAVDALERAART